MRSFSHKSICCLILMAAIVSGTALLVSGVAPAEGLSPSTESFFGSVYNNDVLVTSGYVVTAMVGATKVGETVTDSQGRYGYDPVFEITSSSGKIVNFSINNHPAIQRAVFQGGIARKLDLWVFITASTPTRCSGGSCGATSCSISSSVVPAATVGVPYSTDLNVSGGVSPYTWSIVSGSLPDGLTMDSIFGLIKGVPNNAGTYAFTVRVDDSSSHYQVSTLSIQVKEPTGQTQAAISQTTGPAATVASSGLPPAVAGTPEPSASVSPAASVPATSAAFTFSDLSVTPENVSPDEQVTVSIRVVNGGSAESTSDVVLKINGEEETQKAITLDKGNSQFVTFTVSEKSPGNYTVGVGALSADFQVAAPPASYQSSGMPSVVTGIILAGGLLAVIILLIGIINGRRI